MARVTLNRFCARADVMCGACNRGEGGGGPSAPRALAAAAAAPQTAAGLPTPPAHPWRQHAPAKVAMPLCLSNQKTPDEVSSSKTRTLGVFDAGGVHAAHLQAFLGVGARRFRFRRVSELRTGRLQLRVNAAHLMVARPTV